MVPCPVFPPPHPPWDGGGVWCPCGGVYTYIHTYYLPTYLHTYVHTYIPLHYLTLHYLTLPYITLPYIPYIHTYIHTSIPTYQHTTTTGHGGGTRRTIPPPQATGGGTRRTIPPPQATGGGGPEEPDDTVHPYPLVGGEGGGQRCTIYIYICMYIYIYICVCFGYISFMVCIYI